MDVTFDVSLKFDIYIDNIINNANMIYALICQFSWGFPYEHVHTIL